MYWLKTDSGTVDEPLYAAFKILPQTWNHEKLNIEQMNQKKMKMNIILLDKFDWRIKVRKRLRDRDRQKNNNLCQDTKKIQTIYRGGIKLVHVYFPICIKF